MKRPFAERRSEKTGQQGAYVAYRFSGGDIEPGVQNVPSRWGWGVGEENGYK